MKNNSEYINSKEITAAKVFAALHSFVFRFSVMLSICSVCLALVDALAVKSKISGEKFLYLALLSFLVSAAFSVTDFMKSKKINSVITYTVNFILSYLSFCLILYLMRDDIISNSFNTPVLSFLLLTCVFVLLYTVIAVIRIVGGYIKRKVFNSMKSYEKIYTESSK